MAFCLAQFDQSDSLSFMWQVQQPAYICTKEKCKADISNMKSPLHGLRFHDPRHHAITELAESHASERTIMAIAGHVSPKMLDHYSHVRL
jgi:integrase